MKRLFPMSVSGVLAAALMLCMASSLSTAPILVEAYQEGQIYIPSDEIDTVTAVEISFSVDTSCYVLFTAGALVYPGKGFLQLDGISLFPIVKERGGGGATSIDIAYTYPLEVGEHNVHFRITHFQPGIGATCRNGYLQALIFLPDTATAIAEQPTSDAELLPNTPSLISKGPYVNVQGASELVDATGRVIENAIEEDKVYISDLPTGTYFARDEDRTIVKIVKVQ